MKQQVGLPYFRNVVHEPKLMQINGLKPNYIKRALKMGSCFHNCSVKITTERLKGNNKLRIMIPNNDEETQ